MCLPTVSAVIVSFNTKDKLRRCLSCLTDLHQVIVVDNASQDGSAEMVAEVFPDVVLIRSETNLGFGAANNRGCEHATGELVLYINSDAYAHPDAISKLSQVFENLSVAAAGGKLLNLDGSLQLSTTSSLTLGAVFAEQLYLEKLIAKLRGQGYWNTPFLLSKWETSGSYPETEQVMGACLMVRREPHIPFDERYFLYVEDTDLCLRLRQHGRILYVPDAEFTHELGASSKQEPWRGVIRYNAGKELFFRIHHGIGQAHLCFLYNRFGALLRIGISLLTGRFSKAKTFVRVLTARPSRAIHRSGTD